MPLDAISATLLTTAALLFVALIRRLRHSLWPRARRELRRRWPMVNFPLGASAAAVLPAAQRRAWDLSRRAAPHALLLPRVPLARIVASAAAQGLSADLMVWDKATKARLVVLFESGEPSSRRRQRLETTRAALRAAGIPVCVWQQGAWPSIAAVREQFHAAGISKVSSSSSKRRPRPSGFGVQTQPSTLL
jgi:hypothetical protein